MSAHDRRRRQLRDLYGFDFPEDLFRFWQFANRVRPLEPLRALESIGMHLVGPFEVLAGRFDGRTTRYSQLLHWRYYDDPPEFFSVLTTGDGDGLHWGYYLDEPGEPGSCVTSYFAKDDYEMSEEGDSLFELARLQIEMAHQESLDDADEDEPADGVERRAIADLRDALMTFATGDRLEWGINYEEAYPPRSERSARVVAATCEGMGVVAPGDTYRPLKIADEALWHQLRRDPNPVKVVKEAQRALRDGYPATALKLGKDLWGIGGGRGKEYACDLLDAAYEGLRRPVLREVLRVHRENRKLPSVDILENE